LPEEPPVTFLALFMRLVVVQAVQYQKQACSSEDLRKWLAYEAWQLSEYISTTQGIEHVSAMTEWAASGADSGQV